MRAFIATILLTVALAGCLQGGDGPDDGATDWTTATAPDDWHVTALWGHGVDPVEMDHVDSSEVHRELHDHNNRSHHIGLSTPNFEVLGWDPLITQYHGQNPGGYFCGGVAERARDDGRVLSIVHSFLSEVAIVVVDVTDPDDPFYVGELTLPRTDIYDATITTDGRYAIVSVSPQTPSRSELMDEVPDPPASSSSETQVMRATFTDACGQQEQGPETEVPHGPGTMLVDLADPANPVIADMKPAPVLGPHSVSTTNIDGVEYVASSTTNLQYEASYFQFFTVEETQAGAQLAPYSEYTAQYAQGEAEYVSENPPAPDDPTDVEGTANYLVFDYVTNPRGSLYQGHVEAEIYEHPLTGQILAGLAAWHAGMITIDISDPAVPLPVSVWGDVRDATISHGGYIHSIQPVEDLWGDRFLVLAGQEVVGSFNSDPHRASGQIVLVDMTDPADPEALARWTLPGRMHWTGLETFSTHYFTTIGETLFVAMYHGGVWAADMSEDQWPELPSLGVWIPENQPPEPALYNYHPAFPELYYSPTVLDVFALDDGSLVSYDGESGVYTLRFHPDTQVPVQEPWTEDAWIGV